MLSPDFFRFSAASPAPFDGREKRKPPWAATLAECRQPAVIYYDFRRILTAAADDIFFDFASMRAAI